MSIMDDYDVFLFDLDGTIASEGGAPSPECVGALSQLVNRGKHIGIVTARAIGEMPHVVSRLRSAIGLEQITRQVRFFPSSASAVYRASGAGMGEVEKVASFFPEAEREAMQMLGRELSRVDGATVIDRGVQQTVLAKPRTMAQLRTSLKPRLLRHRTLLVSHSCLHILPRSAGKQRAVEYYSQTCGPCATVAIGDGFYEIPELDIIGNDMDFVGGASTCIQIGRLKPRDARVLYLPLGADGPESTARVLRGMRSKGALATLRPPDCGARSVLEAALLHCGASTTVREFFSRIVDHLLTALEPEELERRLRCAAQMIRSTEPQQAVARYLIARTPIDQGFGRWAGFEGEADWVLRWLWDEHVVRPHVAIAEHVKDRIRAPLMPEELVMSLVRALPYVNRGNRVVLVGKDAECLHPLLTRLVEVCQSVGILGASILEPVGMKISARKTPSGKGVDSAEHVSAGRVARQLTSLLEPDERTAVLSRDARSRLIDAARALSPDERTALDSAFEGRFVESVHDLSRGQLIQRIGDLMRPPAFDEFVSLYKSMAYSLQGRVAERISAAVPIELSDLLLGEPSLDAVAVRIRAQYVATTGRDRMEDREDWQVLNRVLATVLGDHYAALGAFEFPFTPMLRTLMDDTQVRGVLGPEVLFLDASFNGGATVLFLKALRSILAPDAAFRFAAIGGLVMHDPLRRDLEWHGHPYVSVLMEEGAPDRFDFFYDERDEKVAYRSILERARSETTTTVPSRAHIESFCSDHADALSAYRDLTDILDLRHVVRWWLRRDRIWEMRVLSDQIRFRWPYWKIVRDQQRAISLMQRLDEVVTSETRSRLIDEDRELRDYETSEILRGWLARRETWLARGCAFAEQMAREPSLLREYVSRPSVAAERRMQRTVLRTMRPPGFMTS